MKTKIEELREIVTRRTESLKAGCVNQMILEAELTFIEKRHMEEYFMVALRLFAELKKDERILLGPGWNWMLSSHLCYVLGLSNLSPCDIDLSPIFIWGNDSSDLTIGIEIDEDSFDTVFDTAVSMFGYSNVARIPVIDKSKDNKRRQNVIGNGLYVGKSYLQAYALMVCFDGIDKHYSVKDVTDEHGSKYLYAYQNIGHTGNDGVLRFEVIASKKLTRIKRIQERIARNGKIAPALYEKSVNEEQYDLFYSDDLDGVPLSDWYSPKDLLKMLLPQIKSEFSRNLSLFKGY